MRVDCPHCGRQGKLPDGAALPSMVRCPQCQNKFQPVPEAEAVMVATAAAPTMKDCHYCGEQILVAAKKCRHCGEIIDVALRAAEEAKALARGPYQPLVINNNVSSSASASAAAAANAGAYRRSLLRSFIRFIVISFGLIFLGVFMTVGGAKDAGLVTTGIGSLLLVVGVPIYLIRGVWRVLFG